MTLQPSLPADSVRIRPILRIISGVSLVALALWAGFWLWFSISVVISEPTLAWQPYAFIGSLIGLFVAAWRFPRAGGGMLIAAGLFAVYYYDNVWARGLLALPSLLIGIARFAIASFLLAAQSHRQGVGEL